MKRRGTLNSDSINISETENTGSTGLTQEINILDLGSSTPKKRKAKSPLKGVLKLRNLSDDEKDGMNTPVLTNNHLSHVMYSTPVSSQKSSRTGMIGKYKNTRFNLPNSVETRKKSTTESLNLRYKLDVSSTRISLSITVL